MNLSLDPFLFSQEYPESLTRTLSWGHSVCVRFNRTGEYLASGLADGNVVIYDYDTYGVAKILQGHAAAIQSLSWSHDGRYILSACRDWKCILWDLKDEEPKRTINFGTPVLGAMLHPKDPNVFIASLYGEQPKYVRLKEDAVDISDIPNPNDKELTLAMTFSSTGDHIIAGTSKGNLNILQNVNDKLDIIHIVKVTNAGIKMLQLGPSGRKLLVNASDRVVRLLSIPDMARDPVDSWEFNTVHKFQDFVNRLTWTAAAINWTEEFVGATTYNNLDVYLWETTMGSLTKIYDGPKEEMVHLEFHPRMSAMATTGLDSGRIYLWEATIPQKWSALAPDFVELEENEDYEEREDEFDLIDEEERTKRQEEEGIVEVFAKDEEEDGTFVIPLRLTDFELPPPVDDD